MAKHVLVTGASTGLGRDAVRFLAARGYRVFGSVRKERDAEALRLEVGERFTPLLFDVTDAEAVKAAVLRVEQELDGAGLDGLVNNAGIAIGGPLMYQPMDEIRAVFEVNVFGLLGVTKAFLPLLGATQPRRSSPGRIVNISSVGGRISAPFLGTYSATKHAVEALSDAFRRELMLFGIDVVVIEPGSVRTAIWDKAEVADDAAYAGTVYEGPGRRVREWIVQRGRAGRSPEDVSRAILRALESPNPPSRIPLPDDFIGMWLLPRLLPDRVVDRLMGARMGLSPR
jgi:hypothetical protein